jgi:hypothetical protein
MPTTAAIAKVTTGTSIKTMLQIATPSTRQIQILSWGYSLDAVPGSTGGIIELIQTDVGATVTAHVASGVQPLDPNAPASLMTLGTGATGYNATVEGSITATRSFDTDQIPPTAGAASMNYDYQFTPAERPIVAVSKFVRVRVTFAAAVNMLCWVCWDE